jgi:hypothetical protein
MSQESDWLVISINCSIVAFTCFIVHFLCHWISRWNREWGMSNEEWGILFNLLRDVSQTIFVMMEQTTTGELGCWNIETRCRFLLFSWRFSSHWILAFPESTFDCHFLPSQWLILHFGFFSLKRESLVCAVTNNTPISPKRRGITIRLISYRVVKKYMRQR